jgi:hypothetical protein
MWAEKSLFRSATVSATPAWDSTMKVIDFAMPASWARSWQCASGGACALDSLLGAVLDGPVFDRVLFSEVTPWVTLALSFLLPACLALPFIRSFKPLRKLLWGGAAVALIVTASIGNLPYIYAGSGNEDTVALVVQDGVVVAADRRRAGTFLVSDRGSSYRERHDDVLQLHVIDAADGTVACRTIVGLQARLLDVVDGNAWVAAGGFGSGVGWSYRTIRRMSVRDCSLEEVLEPGWRDEIVSLRVGVERIDHVGGTSLLITAKDGSLHLFDMATRTPRGLEAQEAEMYRNLEPSVSRPRHEKSTGRRRRSEPFPFRTSSSGGGANFSKLSRLDGNGWRPISERVYIQPEFLARSSEQERTLLVHRDGGEDGPWILTALDERGEHVWDMSEEVAFGRALPRTRPGGPAPFAVTDATGFIVASQGHVAKLGWNAETLWRQRL